MAVVYFVTIPGTYDATCLAADAKPSSPPDNASLTEVDTGKFYRAMSGSWVEVLNAAYAVSAHTHPESDVTNLTTDLGLKAPLASPAFTGTPTGITKTHVGLGSVDNTADTAKPVSTAQQTALDLKLNTSQFSGLGKITVNTVAPTSPSVGDLWVDTN